MPKDPRLRRYAHILRPPRVSRVWSIKTVTFLVLVVTAATAAIVLLVGHGGVVRKIETTVLICSVFLFVTMATGLYTGARVKQRDLPSLDLPDVGSPSDYMSDGTTVEPVDVGSDDLLGCLLSILVSVGLALFAGFVIWLIVQFGGALIVGVFFALSWLMYRALRIVFARSRQCYGKLWPSIGFALYYTALHTGWLIAVLHFVGR